MAAKPLKECSVLPLCDRVHEVWAEGLHKGFVDPEDGRRHQQTHNAAIREGTRRTRSGVRKDGGRLEKHRTLKPQNRSLHPSPSGDVPPSSPQTQCKSILESESPISIDGPDDMPSSSVSSASSEASVASSTGSKKMCVKDADGETLVLPQELRMFKKLRVNGAAKAPVDLDE